MTANILSGLALAIGLLMALSSVPLEVHQQSGESAAQAQQGEQTDPHSMLEILPASFVGCWRGVVARPDSTQNLNGCEAGAFVPELYTLCYKRKLTGKFELTFSGVQMDAVPADYKVSGTTGRVQVLSSDGIGKVKLRSFIHFDENQAGAPASRDAKWSMDEQTDLACEIKNDDMQVTATYTQTSNGADCFKGTWHALFRRSND